MSSGPLASVPAPGPEHLLALQEQIQRFCGLRLDAQKVELALVRAWPALALMGIADAGHLARRLALPGESAVWDALLPHVTVSETYFLRETRQLQDFAERALPGLRYGTARRGDEAVRVLSAGCSTGEEVYTLAVLLAENGVRGRVTGVDIDPRALAAAETAIYGPSSFRGVPDSWRDRHFEPTSGQTWRVRPGYRTNVDFTRLNLLAAQQALAGSRYDAIFCRNVLIYFDRPTQLSVIEQLRRLLVPGGYLCLGHSEMFFDVDLGLEIITTDRATMYRVPEAP